MYRESQIVNHSTGEHVCQLSDTNGMEFFWSMLERSHKGTFHKFSKDAERYLTEFSEGHGVCNSDIVGQVRSVVGKLPAYRHLIDLNGLNSGAQH